MVHERLVAEHGFTGDDQRVKMFLAEDRPPAGLLVQLQGRLSAVTIAPREDDLPVSTSSDGCTAVEHGPRRTNAS